jgi:hypothetical protein
MKTVWAVAQGSYSDYRVLATFETRELAQKVAATSDYFQVESFVMYDAVPVRWTVYFMGIVSRNVYIDKGKSQKVWGEPYGNVQVKWPWDMACNTDGKPYICQGKDSFIHIEGVDKARVEKAFNDFWGPIEAALAGLV